jgi:group I intron endonuclease
MNGIVYAYINKKNWKMYVGQTTDMQFRMRDSQHSRAGDGCVYFNKAIKKYGRAGFELVTLEDDINSLEKLDERERFWIAHFGSFGKLGYNMTSGGGGSPDRKHSEEAKKSISANNARYWKGKNLPDDVRAKVSATLTGRKQSEETKQKRAESLKKSWAEGRHKGCRSPEARKKISEAGKGRIRSDETKARMSASKRGIHHSEEAKINMRLSRKNNKRIYILEKNCVCFSIAEASKIIGCARSLIPQALKSNGIAKGFHISVIQ